MVPTIVSPKTSLARFSVTNKMSCMLDGYMPSNMQEDYA